MVKKDQKWDWTEKQEGRFTKELVLAALNLDKKMRIEVDTSDYTIGGVLSIEYEDDIWSLIAFISKSLNKTERNYEIHNK